MSIASLVLTASIAAAAPKPDCRVLSISGGGSFGAFEAGVLSGMIEQQPGVDFDYMLGVSAGALNAGYLSTFPVGPAGLKEGVANLKSLWSTTKSEDVWSIRLDPFKAPPSLLSVDPLQLLLEQILQGRSVQRKVTIGTTNLATGATARHDEAELSKSTSLLLRASSAIPLIFPPVEVNGTRHVDGGNSANVLTVHGIDRCDLAAKARGDALPNILIDVILAQQTIEQVDPAETTVRELPPRVLPEPFPRPTHTSCQPLPCVRRDGRCSTSPSASS